MNLVESFAKGFGSGIEIYKNARYGDDVSFDDLHKSMGDKGLAEPTEEMPRALFHDPYSVMDWGGWREKPSALTYDTLRQMSVKNTSIAAIIQLRVNQLSQFTRPQQTRYEKGYRIILRDRRDRNRTMTNEEAKQAAEIERMMETTGFLLDDEKPSDRDSFKSFIKKAVRDILVYDAWAYELIRDKKGRISRFIALPSETIRPAVSDIEHMTPAEKRERVTFVQIFENTVIAEFGPDDIAWNIMNPRSDLRVNGFGFSPLEQLTNLITAWLYGFQYNVKFFSQGSAVKGILNVKGAIPDRQLRAFRRLWYSMVSGVNNCLDGSSQIWTKQGAKAIGSILAPKESEKKIDVWTGDGWAKANVYRTGKKALCKVKLGNGIETLCSPNHRFRVLSGAELCWKQWDELHEGDYVAVNAQSVVSRKVPSFKGKPIPVEVCEVLGWMIGDGSIVSEGKQNQIKLYYHPKKEKDILERHVRILSKWGLPAEKKEKVVSEEEARKLCERYGFKSVQKKRIWGQLCNAEFTRWLLKIGFTTSKAGKTIPSFVHTLPAAHKTAFLRGLFSADGNLGRRRDPCLSIRNDRLREDVKLLLLSFGIRTNLSEGKTHIIIIGDKRARVEGKSILRVKDKDRFLQTIGFLQKHKQPLPLKNEIEKGKNDTLPLETTMALGKWIRENRKNPLKNKKERDLFNAVVCGCESCSRPRILRFIAAAGLAPPEWLLDYHFEPVVSLQRTNEKRVMYDLEVATEEHQFMVNGVLNHNSWRTPILNSEDIQWVNMHSANREMEYSAWMDWLTKLICAVYGVDPIEINFQFGNTGQKSGLNEGSMEFKLTESKDKGLRPLAEYISDSINSNIIWEINPDFEFGFTGLDAKEEEKERKGLIEEVTNYRLINEVRAQMDLDPLPENGDIILNPTFTQVMSMQQGQGEDEGGDGGPLEEFGDSGDEQQDEQEDGQPFDIPGSQENQEELANETQAPGKIEETNKSALSKTTQVYEELRKARVTKRIVGGIEDIVIDIPD